MLLLLALRMCICICACWTHDRHLRPGTCNCAALFEADGSGGGTKASTTTRVHPKSTRRRRNRVADNASGTCTRIWDEVLGGFGKRFIWLALEKKRGWKCKINSVSVRVVTISLMGRACTAPKPHLYMLLCVTECCGEQETLLHSLLSSQVASSASAGNYVRTSAGSCPL